MLQNNANQNQNKDSSSLALDLETLSVKYKNLLIKYRQSVLDYIDNLNTESAKPCAKYSADSKNINQACYDEIWKKSGCTTTGRVNASSEWAKERTLNQLILNSWHWATTLTDYVHRNGCYGTSEGNPYYLIGVGTNGRLYSCKGIGGSNIMGSEWIRVNDDLANDLASVCTGNDGKLIIGSTTYGHVIYKDNWDDPKWKKLTNQPCCVLSVAMGQDGTLVGVGTDNQLWSKPNLNGQWTKTSDPGEWISSICIAPDGSIFCVGGSGYIWKKNSYKDLQTQGWEFMGNNTCCVKAITVAPDGTFIGVGTDNQIYTKPSYKDLSTQWTGPYSYPWSQKTSCCVIGVTTITNPNYNGALFSTAKQPNYKINAPILTSIKGQTFWGTSSVGESTSKSVQECSALCSNNERCSGATFNPDKQYCWLRGGEGSAMPGLSNDYAIIPKSRQLLKIVESLNNEINSVNKQMQSKIDEVYSIYGKQVEQRLNKNYSLVNQYDALNRDREKINNMIKEYQNLETTENEMGVYITKNYFLFFVFFAVVFIAIIILAMTSLDPNTSSAVAFAIVPAVTNAKALASNVNPFYIMFGIILLVVISYLYNQYITSIYNYMPSFKNMGQLGMVYFLFVIVIIFVAITYFNKNNGVSIPNMNITNMNIPSLNK